MHLPMPLLVVRTAIKHPPAIFTTQLSWCHTKCTTLLNRLREDTIHGNMFRAATGTKDHQISWVQICQDIRLYAPRHWKTQRKDQRHGNANAIWCLLVSAIGMYVSAEPLPRSPGDGGWHLVHMYVARALLSQAHMYIHT